jgi:hypothetical protein
MVLFPSGAVAQRDGVSGAAKEDPPTLASGAVTRDGVDRTPWDVVDQASWDSFPASDAPPWTLGYSGPPAAGRAGGGMTDAQPP